MRFESNLVIKASLEDVAGYLSNLENDPQWRREWVDAEAVSDGPVRVGGATALFAQFLGRRIKTVYEVAVYEPNRLTEWRTVSGPLPLTFRRAFEAVEGGTQVTFSYDANPNVVLRLLGPLLLRMGRRQLEGDMPRLRAILEG